MQGLKGWKEEADIIRAAAGRGMDKTCESPTWVLSVAELAGESLLRITSVGAADRNHLW